jgi:hypothetical protein
MYERFLFSCNLLLLLLLPSEQTTDFTTELCFSNGEGTRSPGGMGTNVGIIFNTLYL